MPHELSSPSALPLVVKNPLRRTPAAQATLAFFLFSAHIAPSFLRMLIKHFNALASFTFELWRRPFRYCRGDRSQAGSDHLRQARMPSSNPSIVLSIIARRFSLKTPLFSVDTLKPERADETILNPCNDRVPAPTTKLNGPRRQEPKTNGVST